MRPSAGVTPDNDERAVWWVVIEEHLGLRRGDTVVLDDSTIAPDYLSDVLGQGKHEEWSDFPYKAVLDLIGKPAVSPSSILGTASRLHWLTAEDRQRIFQKYRGVDRSAWVGLLAARFPGATRIGALSRVGFDSRRKHAAVAVDWNCGPLCGGLVVVLLRRDGSGGWRIIDVIPAVIS